jgi:hypothetical protein
MAQTDADVRRLISASTTLALGNSLADALSFLGQSSHSIANVIVATNVSQTINFGSLLVGDRVVVIPAVAGNSNFVTVATAGTLGQAAVVGSLYIVLRAKEAASAVKY